MSASLVGSEMCIRDSLNADYHRCNPQCATQNQAIVNGNEYDICLLYTSDAADGMQCADLGGR
eukprot:274637-Alexandrium_andersonii.AAC.1